VEPHDLDGPYWAARVSADEIAARDTTHGLTAAAMTILLM
jgi:hypothetical protein